MSEYIIKGGKKVGGEVTISGSKNASLPIIAATICATSLTMLGIPLESSIKHVIPSTAIPARKPRSFTIKLSPNKSIEFSKSIIKSR